MQTYQRIESLDLIRGIAVLGILYMNIMSIVAPIEAYSIIDWAWFTNSLDQTIYIIQSLFIESRFMSMFSLLFGIGLTLQWQRLEMKSLAPKPWLRRRLFWLLIFGLIHGFVFWAGDILSTYAIAGFFLLFMMNWSVRRKMIVAVVFMVIAQLAMGFLLLGTFFADIGMFDYAAMPFSAEYLAEERAKLGTSAMFVNNASDYLQLIFAGPIATWWEIMATMLIGSVLFETNYFSKLRKRSIAFLIIGFIWGAIVTRLRLHWGTDTDQTQATIMLMMPAGLLMAIGYANIIALFANRQGLLTTALKNTGKTAFTVYLAQSVILVIVFQWLAPQWWGVMTRGQAWLFISAYLALLVIAAHWWQSNHGQGPMEKLWRTLAYRKLERAQS
ncbi:DUF418 domain-containing protein [Salinibius halmophilus]|uniref:DUF418 domain-containing protein n=1 Tax=Salinibius halmophilus TaxID=1853216 RepID=UPI0013147479|nr:DUF418 domain-containing protein [Salinibius halmophilus]